MRSEHCRDIISATENDPNCLNSIVTGDESCCFQHDSETKRGMAVTKFTASQNIKEIPSKIKIMLSLRSSIVLLQCGTENKITSVEESSPCTYVFEFTTPALCKTLPPEIKKILKNDLDFMY
ncbi:glucosidase 2 subunit beta [Trichonephila clavipes]|nr:glucosidase 2 subunit beta [Trichonephila clavipes]